MKFKIHNYTPYLYREKSFDGKKAGTAKYLLMTLDPTHKDDKGIFYHELLHIQHWWITTILFFVLFLLFNPYLLFAAPFIHGIAMTNKFIRFRAEVKCFAIQSKYHSDPDYALKYFAWAISTKYNVDVTEEKAHAALRKEYYG